MTAILALDLASVTGWARNMGPGATTYGSVKFTGALGARALAFEDWLYCAVHEHGVEAIAIEAPVPVKGATNLDTLAWLLGMHVIVRKFCAKYKRRLIIVNVATWRSFFIGRAQAPKEDPATGQKLVTSHIRRAWLKAATLRECRERGHAPTNDNEADALGVLIYCLACLDGKTGIDHGDVFAEAA